MLCGMTATWSHLSLLCEFLSFIPVVRLESRRNSIGSGEPALCFTPLKSGGGSHFLCSSRPRLVRASASSMRTLISELLSQKARALVT
ncbi:hypothetical protein F5Y10DRAFT_254401 [Nemania abortiva]|nr:hypothetical protein F5Y10DRAFT_254401 [Nemania abortiva]